MLAGTARISREVIDRAAYLLLEASPAGSRVILFGSYARGTARRGSDLDFLVVQPMLTNRRVEMVRLRALLRPLGVPADVLVVSRDAFDAWKDWPNNVIHEAHTEGAVYGPADEPRRGLPTQSETGSLSGREESR